MALQVATAADGVMRDAHYVVPTGATDPVRTLLLEPQRTNICVRSQELDTWSVTTATVTANAAIAPDGTATADLLVATGAVGRAQRTITFSGDGDKAVSFWVKQGVSVISTMILRDSTASANRFTASITWTAGVPSVSSGFGTLLGVVSYGNGWYRVLGLAVGVVAANTTIFVVYAHNSTVGVAGDSTYYWGMQVEDVNGAPSSYIPTAATTVTRNADDLYWTLPQLNPPQEMTFYLRGVVQEFVVGATANTSWFNVGSISSTVANDMIFVQRRNNNRLRATLDVGGVEDLASNPVSTPLVGDVMETRLTLSAAGVLSWFQTLNNAAEEFGTASAALGLPLTWNATILSLLSRWPFAYTNVAIALGNRNRAYMRAQTGVT
jgi:hypothetical protein